MLQKGYQQASDLLLIFGLFFLSNVSAFIAVLWLIPEFVFFEFVFWLMLTALSVWILNKNGLLSNLFENLKKNWFILPFLIFSGFSIFWSVYREISFYRWSILLFTIITGGYIGLRQNIQQIIKILSFFGVCILFLSAVLVFFAPRIGVMNYYIIQGAWKGVYWHKNHMGLIAAFINILFLLNVVYSSQSGRGGILPWGLLYFISLLIVYETDSAAAYITTILLHGAVLLALILLKFRERIHRYHYLIFLTIIIFVSLILYMNIDRFIGIFNRNTTLTGRVPMWTHLFDTYVSRRPLLGYGFNAFWYLESHRVEMQQAAGYPDPIVIADNGFIDLLVNTGYSGLVLFSIFYFGAWWHSLKYASKAKDINGVFPALLMFYTLLANISWSLLFENESFIMLIMISVLFSISRNTPINFEG